MNNQDVLAQLIAQAADEGSDLVTLRAIIEEASQLGAERMLAQLGLDDDTAHSDLSELRELLQAWRDAKASAWRSSTWHMTCSPPSPVRPAIARRTPAAMSAITKIPRAIHLAQPMMSLNFPNPGGAVPSPGLGTAASTSRMGGR